jgi:hypothetical protein
MNSEGEVRQADTGGGAVGLNALSARPCMAAAGGSPCFAVPQVESYAISHKKSNPRCCLGCAVDCQRQLFLSRCRVVVIASSQPPFFAAIIGAGRLVVSRMRPIPVTDRVAYAGSPGLSRGFRKFTLPMRRGVCPVQSRIRTGWCGQWPRGALSTSLTSVF